VQDFSAVVPPLWPRIRDTFVAPARLVQRIRAGKPWIDVLLISTFVAVLGVLTMPDEIFLEPMRDAVTRRGRPVEITSPPAEVARWGRIIGMLATLATHPVVAVTLAGALTFIFSVIGRGAGTFRDYMSLTAHALLIPAVGTVVAGFVRLTGGLSAGGLTLDSFMAAGDQGNLLLAALLSVDPFIIWMLVVLAIGVHGVDRRNSMTRAGILLIGAYLTLVVASTAILHPAF
jgi:hypothetical protein